MIVKHFLVILDMMHLSYPPYSCDLAPLLPLKQKKPLEKNNAGHKEEHNCQIKCSSLDAFELLFYQLLAICNMCVAV
jgi:hypothetical protein